MSWGKDLLLLSGLAQVKKSVLDALIEAVFVSVIEGNFIVAENIIFNDIFFQFKYRCSTNI